MPTLVEKIKNLNKDELKQVSSALAKQLVINIALGIVATVAVTLASGAIVAKIQSSKNAE